MGKAQTKSATSQYKWLSHAQTRIRVTDVNCVLESLHHNTEHLRSLQTFLINKLRSDAEQLGE